MFDHSSNLGLHFSNLTRFAMLFDNETIGVCVIRTIQPRSKMESVFFSIRYQRLLHNWDMHNAFVFDGRHKVRAYL